MVDFLAAVAPTVLVFAVPNAARREHGGRAGNAVPGLRRGVFDLSLVLPDGIASPLSRSRRQSASRALEQIAFGKELTARGVPWCVATGIDDVRAFLAGLGIRTREAANHGRDPIKASELNSAKSTR